MHFIGTGVAVITPFTSNKEVDFPALENLIEHLIKNGIDYLVALGTTAESATLTEREKFLIIETFIKKVDKRVPIVVGTGGNNTRNVVSFIKALENYEINGLLSVCPYYNKPNQNGLIAHFDAILSSTDRDVILYNVPGRTGINMDAKTTVHLANKYQNAVAIKEASGSLEQCMAIINEVSDDFAVISGDDPLTLPIIASGGKGVISVVAQGFPKEYSQMVNYCLNGDFASARPLHYSLLNITQLIFKEGNPAGIKYLLTKQGIIQNELRLPLIPISQNLEQAMNEKKSIVSST